jgi:hypothetical protein
MNLILEHVNIKEGEPSSMTWVRVRSIDLFTKNIRIGPIEEFFYGFSRDEIL